MELCDLTLEDRIKEMGRTMVQEIRELELDFVREQNSVAETVETPPEATRERIPSVQSDEISGSTTPAESNANPTPADEIDWEPVMDILDDMTSGLIYIHGKNIVHRDLKPRNGTSLQLKHMLTRLQCSFHRDSIVGSSPTLAPRPLPLPKSWSQRPLDAAPKAIAHRKSSEHVVITTNGLIFLLLVALPTKSSPAKNSSTAIGM